VNVDGMQGFFHHGAKRTLDTEIRRSAKLRTELADYGMASDFDKSGGGIVCESVDFEGTPDSDSQSQPDPPSEIDQHLWGFEAEVASPASHIGSPLGSPNTCRTLAKRSAYGCRLRVKATSRFNIRGVMLALKASLGYGGTALSRITLHLSE
jgi:hypothetical protein